MRCSWSDLGDVKNIGEYLVLDVGTLDLIQLDIDHALEMGGDPLLCLIPMGTAANGTTLFRIGKFVPATNQSP